MYRLFFAPEHWIASCTGAILINGIEFDTLVTV